MKSILQMKKIQIIAIITTSLLIIYIIYSFIEYKKLNTQLVLRENNAKNLIILCGKSDKECVEISRRIAKLGYKVSSIFTQNNSTINTSEIDSYLAINEDISCKNIPDDECKTLANAVESAV